MKILSKTESELQRILSDSFMDHDKRLRKADLLISDDMDFRPANMLRYKYRLQVYFTDGERGLIFVRAKRDLYPIKRALSRRNEVDRIDIEMPYVHVPSAHIDLWRTVESWEREWRVRMF